MSLLRRHLAFAELAALAALSLALGCGGVSDIMSDGGDSIDAAGDGSDGGAGNDGGPTADAAVEFPADPVIHLALDGDLTDSSGNENGASANLPLSYVADRFGMAERSVDLVENSGNDFFPVIEAPALGLTGELTIAAWIKADSQGSERIAGQGDWFSLAFQSGDAVGFSLFDINGNAQTAIALDPTSNDATAWVLYTGVIENSGGSTSIKLYRDGDLVDEEPLSSSLTPAENCSFYVGTFHSGTQCSGTEGGQKFSGLVDDVRVYNRALDPAEVQLLYEEGGWPDSGS